MIFDEKVQRCNIGLMTYNVYYLSKVINDCFGKQKSNADSKLAWNQPFFGEKSITGGKK